MKYWQSSFLLVFSILFLLSGCVEHDEILAPTQRGTEVQGLAKIADDGRYLVGFKTTPDADIITGLGGQVDRTFSIVPAIAAQLSPQAVEALSQNPNVRYVELDYPVYALEQTVPWGIDRVFGDEEYPFPTWGTTKGTGFKVAILDTGIDENHEDLTVAGGVTTVDDTHWGNDGNGHGTHVAGTVAALDNTLGVVGVAPEVSLYAVKVLSDGGSGTVSSVVAGIEWAVNNNLPILNMSLGSSSDSQTLREACDAAYAAGHLLVAAAGNSGNPGGRGDNVGYPAKYESVIAVASSTINDTRSSFSSTGSAVELIAPGSSILSTLPGNNYGTYSGTSMASPHVAGVAALAWASKSSLSNVDVRQILRDTAEDLGLSSNHQGYGLARADLAVAVASGAEPGPEPEPDPDPEPEPEPEPGATVTVSAITYATSGGRFNDRHLHVTVYLEDDTGSPVANASVSVELYRDESLYGSASGTTGSNGTVTFSFNNAPSGTYTTVVTNVTASGLEWDGVTPPNEFEK